MSESSSDDSQETQRLIDQLTRKIAKFKAYHKDRKTAKHMKPSARAKAKDDLVQAARQLHDFAKETDDNGVLIPFNFMDYMNAHGSWRTYQKDMNWFQEYDDSRSFAEEYNRSRSRSRDRTSSHQRKNRSRSRSGRNKNHNKDTV